uniref:Tetraspanin n=1 Tax=Setaria digitata TaxID=48799 RepID=A0A915Q4R0_9BILA
MKSVSQTASKTVISYIHKLIQTNKFSHLIALIYDNILENSEKSFLNKAQTEIILSLLRLPNKQVPNIVSYADLCSLLKDAYDEKIGNLSDKNEEIISKSENNWDQGNLEELEVLSTLNSLRNKTHTQCPDIFNFIRQENLIRTVMRQACRLQRLKEELFEMEQKMNCLVAHYVAEKYCACQKGEYSECDSGCHTDRSSSSNNSITKLFVIKKEDINDSSMNACQDFLTTNNGHKHSGTDSHKKVVKLLNEFGKSLYDAHTYINDPCTSAFARDDGQSSNDFALSINQISEDMIMNEATMISSSTIDSQSKKSMNARSNITLNPLKRATRNCHSAMALITSAVKKQEAKIGNKKLRIVPGDVNSEERSLIPATSLRYIIYACNIVMTVVGTASLAMGGWLRSDSRFRDFLSQRYRNVVEEAFWQAPTLYIFSYFLIIIGMCMVVVGMVGCCGATTDSRVLLLIYAVSVCILMVSTISAISYLVFKKFGIDVEVSDALTYMVQNYYQGAGIVQESLDRLQEAFRCCGNEGCGDFRFLHQDIPRSCDFRCDGCHYRIIVALRIGFSIAFVIFSIVVFAEFIAVASALVLVMRSKNSMEALYKMDCRRTHYGNRYYCHAPDQYVDLDSLRSSDCPLPDHHHSEQFILQRRY